MHGLQQRHGTQGTFVYLDSDDARTDPIKQQFGYRVQPHLFLLDGQGNALHQWIGAVGEAELEQALVNVSP